MRIIITTVISVLLLASCNKEREFKPDPVEYKDGVHAMVDGAEYEAKTSEALVTDFGNLGSSSLLIRARNEATSENITLYYYLDEVEPGEYQLKGDAQSPKSTAALQTGVQVYYAEEGMLTIDTYDEGVIKGQFNFTTTHGEELEGTFSLEPELRIL